MLLQWRAICCRTSVSKTPKQVNIAAGTVLNSSLTFRSSTFPKRVRVTTPSKYMQPTNRTTAQKSTRSPVKTPWIMSLSLGGVLLFKTLAWSAAKQHGIHHGFFKNACGSCKLRVFGVLRVLGVGTKFSICSIQPNKKRTPIQSCRGQPSCSWKILNFSKRTILRCNGMQRCRWKAANWSNLSSFWICGAGRWGGPFPTLEPCVRLGSYSSTEDMPSTSINSIWLSLYIYIWLCMCILYIYIYMCI